MIRVCVCRVNVVLMYAMPEATVSGIGVIVFVVVVTIVSVSVLVFPRKVLKSETV